MSIPYRTQRALKRFFVVLLILAIVAVLFWLCWLLWLNRYVVYTEDGAVLDFERSAAELSGTPALPPEAGDPVTIYFNEGDDAVETTKELTQLTGYYIDTAALKGDIEVIKQQIRSLPAGTPVMIEVKNSYGAFYYNTSVSEHITDTLDAAKVDELITFLNKQDLYTIARLPSLRDYAYGLNHTRDGLPTAGGYLWADEDYRYWLNPGSEGTLTFLISIANELKNRGFDEVVFFEFEFPKTNSIVFRGDKAQTLADAAQTLVTTCSATNFTVSFEGSDGFTPPLGRSRVYRENIEPIDAEDVANTSNVTDTAINLVFVTPLYDTRFNDYGVLRPLDSVI